MENQVRYSERQHFSSCSFYAVPERGSSQFLYSAIPQKRPMKTLKKFAVQVMRRAGCFARLAQQALLEFNHESIPTAILAKGTAGSGGLRA